MSLEGYLADQYNRDSQDITAIQQVLKGVAATLCASYDEFAGFWPYELKAGQTVLTGIELQGTSAMILAAIGKMCGSCTLRDGSIPEELHGLPERLLQVFEGGVTCLAELVKRKGAIYSGTFGDHDPLTISHLTELARGLSETSVVRDTIEVAIARTRASATVIGLMAKGPDNRIGPFWCARSAFVALRLVRAHADLNHSKAIRAEPYKGFFESRLHEQLSFSSIPDSRFDPAELAFCLEGLLICAQESVDPVLFERVIRRS